MSLVGPGADAVRRWIEELAGGRIAHSARQPTVREAWAIDVARPDGGSAPLFLRCDRGAGFGINAQYSLEREARDVATPFGDLAGSFRLYERLSGVPLDLARVRYYRVAAMVRTVAALVVTNQALDASADAATLLAWEALYARMTCDALAAAIGVEIAPAELPEPAPESPRSGAVRSRDGRARARPALADRCLSGATGYAKVRSSRNTERTIASTVSRVVSIAPPMIGSFG